VDIERREGRALVAFVVGDPEAGEIIKSGREICGSSKKTLRSRKFASILALRTGVATGND
jgi:hypothetical protein